MSLRGSRIVAVGVLVAACCVLALLSCGKSPTAPDGRLLVCVEQNVGVPSPGKRIEIVGTPLSQMTNESGLAFFVLRPGMHLVRAHDLGTPGPSRPYVDQTVEVQSARTTEAQFYDCQYCR